jgi:rhodanese-related sulfurtransferase
LAVLVDSMTAIAMPSPVVVYCATGNRSLTAMSLLRDRGWPDVSDLLGGYSAWVGGGRTVSS